MINSFNLKAEALAFVIDNSNLLANPLAKFERLTRTELDVLIQEIELKQFASSDAIEDAVEIQENVTYSTIETTRANGEVVAIECAMLEFIKTAVSRGVIKFHFAFGSSMVSLRNSMLESILENQFDNDIVKFNSEMKGKIFPIVNEAITLPASAGGRASYTVVYNGRILESAVPEMVQARENALALEFALAKKSAKMRETLGALDEATQAEVRAQIAAGIAKSLGY